jgi:hypothetical protein
MIPVFTHLRIYVSCFQKYSQQNSWPSVSFHVAWSLLYQSDDINSRYTDNRIPDIFTFTDFITLV